MRGTATPLGRGARFGDRRFLFVLGGLTLAGIAFLLGRWTDRREETTPRATAPEGEGQLWTCGMHPDVIQEQPGSCPLCGMALTPVSRSTGTGIAIDPVVVQNMGVRLAAVEEGPLESAVRTFGGFREAEPLQVDVTLKVGGYVEKVYADTVGMEIGEGDALFELYSPEILVAQEELLASRRARLEEAVDTARRRLRLWDFSQEEIERVEGLSRADGRVTFRARSGGVLVEKNLVLGSSVMPGARALRITDYSKLWLDAQAYEYQIPHLRVGQEAVARVESFPGEAFEGEVIFLSPSLDERARTATVRLAFANPERRLLPGMYARVELRSLLADRALQVPREAIVDTGVRQVAFVQRGEGKFDPRTVRVGRAGSNGKVEILEGLAPGESVVVSGQFLLDAETRLREARRKFQETGVGEMPPGHVHGAGEPLAGTPGPGPEPAPASPASPGTRRSVDDLLRPYLRLVDRLAVDEYDSAEVEEIRRAARAIASEANAELAALGEKLAQQGDALASAGEDGRRRAFAALSETVVRLVEVFPPSKAVGGTLFVLRCPMFPGSWLQPSREVTNPLYGTAMLHCGEVVRAIVPEDASSHEGHGPR